MREREERVRVLQQKHDALIEQLPRLDFTNDVALLDWLCEFQEPSDHVDVVVQKDVVVKTFIAHGYRPGVNTGKDFDRNNRDNFARWAIGEALNQLEKFGAINQVFHNWVDDFKKKFVS